MLASIKSPSVHRLLSRFVAVAALLAASASAIAQVSPAPPKFKRALIIAGGGITPAVGIGIVAGVRSQGWDPDVIITSCGSAMAAAILNAYPDGDEALAYAKSPAFYQGLSQVKVATSSLFSLKKIFDGLKDSDGIPDLFGKTVLSMPDNVEGMLPNNRFDPASAGPRIVILSARASFGPTDVGTRGHDRPWFTQVYFTDARTAERLQGMASPIKKSYPGSFVSEATEVVTDVTTDQATRASISDPILINPASIRGQYYFTGAIDLRPVELARQLADEVVVTYPESVFKDYEKDAISKTFGYNPTVRALQTTVGDDLKWIDVSGLGDVSFNPKPSFLSIESGIPKTLDKFVKGIQKQHDFGFERGAEAIRLQGAGKTGVRTHLRKPLEPDCDDPEEKSFCAPGR